MRLFTLIIATAMLLTLTASPAGGQEANYSREGADSCLSCHEEESVFASDLRQAQFLARAAARPLMYRMACAWTVIHPIRASAGMATITT